MKIIVRVIASNIKKVLQAGEFKVDHTYQLTDGCHSGRLIKINHIAYHKQVVIEGKRYRQITGTLVGETTNVNAVLEHLQAIV